MVEVKQAVVCGIVRGRRIELQRAHCHLRHEQVSEAEARLSHGFHAAWHPAMLCIPWIQLISGGARGGVWLLGLGMGAADGGTRAGEC